MTDGACGDPYTPIYEIQGRGDQSPFEGQTVMTEGVVTVDLQRNNQHQGFFLQSIQGDGDSSTSDGVWVRHQDTWDGGAIDVSVGDHVRLEARVSEWDLFGDWDLSETQLGSLDPAAFQFCGKAKVKALKLTPREFNMHPERYEGMFVKFPGNFFVSDTFNLHRFGEIWVADNGVVETPTNQFEPDSDALHEFATENMSQVLMIEDGSRFSNPDPVPFLRANDTLRLGDMTNNPTGGIQYSFDNYKLTASDLPIFHATNRRGAAPNTGGKVTVASFNVLNYWTTLGGRGASTQDQLDAQTNKLVDAILGMGADILGLQEIENHPTDAPIVALVDALNRATGSEVWSRVDGFQQNVYPIVNEIIYRNDVVTPVGNAMTLQDPAFDDFRGTPPHDPDDQLGRRPIAQAFEGAGGVFTVVVNHFKSKSFNPAALGTPDDDAGDGQSFYNDRRVRQADAVLEWLPFLQSEVGDDDVLVIGDLNAYLQEDPITTLESGLKNLLEKYDQDPYSFNFLAFFAAPHIGRGTLDHAFGTPSLANQVTSVKIWHINADEPRFLDSFDPEVLGPGPYRSSDHDPVLIGLNPKRD